MTTRQLTFADDSDEYREFVEKFKPNKTTDDCYTPELVYDAVAAWVASEYGLDPSTFVRPFWPNGDFTAFDYDSGCTVVDNPPFSLLSTIIRWYQEHGIGFFLFAPSLTTFTAAIIDTGGCAVCAMADITYDNGANVRTSFVTNLEDGKAARSAPELYAAVQAANDEVLKASKRSLPKYEFPYDVLTAARLGWMSVHGTEFAVRHGDCVRISSLDAMKGTKSNSGIFGGGLLLSKRAAAERAAAERAAAERAAAERAAAERAAAKKWELSDREKRMQELLGGGRNGER